MCIKNRIKLILKGIGYAFNSGAYCRDALCQLCPDA